MTRTSRISGAFGSAGRKALLELLSKQISAVLEGAELCLGLAASDLDSEAARARIADIEHEGDSWRTEFVETLSRALVTPFEREDMFRLSRSIDDVLDGLRDFVREIDLYSVESPEWFVPLLTAVRDGVGLLGEAIAAIDENRGDTMPLVLGAKRSCNQVRRRYQEQLAEIFNEDISGETLKRRELLRRLDVVGLRLGEAADALADGVMKRWQ